MADARTEQILAAVKTALTGLATTGANVERGRIYPHQVEKLPALSIMMGADVPAAELMTGLVDWDFSFMVEAAVRVAPDYTDLESGVETELNQVRKEVHIALFADTTLGLSFVHDIIPGPVDQPQLHDEGDAPHGSLAMQFTVRYRSSRADISA